MQRRMGEAVARVARRVNETVESQGDTLGKAAAPAGCRAAPSPHRVGVRRGPAVQEGRVFGSPGPGAVQLPPPLTRLSPQTWRTASWWLSPPASTRRCAASRRASTASRWLTTS